MKKLLGSAILAGSLITAAPAVMADEYVVDTQGAHAFVQFRVKHLGYSWLYGRFNDFDGEFTYDEKDPSKNKIKMTVDTSSVDSNHARRDKHIRSGDFLNTDKYGAAVFESTKYIPGEGDKAKLEGMLTLYGNTKPLTVDIEYIGGGKDPWGGYRQGFQGSATIKPEEWGVPMTQKLGPEAAEVELILSVEGVRKK